MWVNSQRYSQHDVYDLSLDKKAMIPPGWSIKAADFINKVSSQFSKILCSFSKGNPEIG
jgi:hypothetical protein